MKKLKLKNLKFDSDSILSRDQLKKVLGGDDPPTSGICAIGSSCELYIPAINDTKTGDCFYELITWRCYCRVTVNGTTYETKPGMTSMCVI